MKFFDISTSDARSSELVGFHLSFYEIRMRGSKETLYVVEAEESTAEIPVNEKYYFSSWGELKRIHPELIDLLRQFSQSELWDADWRENDRVLFVQSMEGHEGLYDNEEVVYLDLLDLEEDAISYRYNP
jgi:hypothetical protein